MSGFKARSGPLRRVATIFGIGLIAVGLSVAAAPAASADPGITICSAGVCTTTPFQPTLCYYDPITDQINCT
ncbi:MAG: hypothetical protein ACRDSR_12745 [Pseudonocardiaceae bacterium]